MTNTLRGDFTKVNPSKSIPIGDLALAERRGIRDNTDAQLLDLFLASGVVTAENEAVLRDALPTTDFALTGGTSANWWLITALGTAGTEQNYISALQLTTTQAAGFYGVASPMAAPNIGRIRFALGPSLTTIRGVFQLEAAWSRLEPAAYWSTPILYKPQQVITVAVTPFRSFAANSEQLTIYARMIDPLGTTVSGPTI